MYDDLTIDDIRNMMRYLKITGITKVNSKTRVKYINEIEYHVSRYYTIEMIKDGLRKYNITGISTVNSKNKLKYVIKIINAINKKEKINGNKQDSIIKIKEKIYYHQTSKYFIKSILKNGFIVTSGGNQRFGEGIYFLNHPGARYGEVTIKCSISGKYINMIDKYGDKWRDFKSKYWNIISPKNYTSLTEAIKKDFPNVDGIIFEVMLVVWNVDKIKIIEVMK